MLSLVLLEKAVVLLSRLLSNTVSFFSFFQVNQKGSEKPLEQTFAKMVNSMANGMVRYMRSEMICSVLKVEHCF